MKKLMIAKTLATMLALTFRIKKPAAPVQDQPKFNLASHPRQGEIDEYLARTTPRMEPPHAGAFDHVVQIDVDDLFVAVGVERGIVVCCMLIDELRQAGLGYYIEGTDESLRQMHAAEDAFLGKFGNALRYAGTHRKCAWFCDTRRYDATSAMTFRLNKYPREAIFGLISNRDFGGTVNECDLFRYVVTRDRFSVPALHIDFGLDDAHDVRDTDFGWQLYGIFRDECATRETQRVGEEG